MSKSPFFSTRWYPVYGTATFFLIFCVGCFSPSPTASTGKTQAEEANLSVAEQESLWTRPGIDWPRMLGPSGDSRSLEKNLLLEWPKDPPIAWVLPTGTGYGNGVVANGRWYQFDRFGNQERLSCVHAETGKHLWHWEAPVDYVDMYGYNNGPRCSPVADGDRVYSYGVTGRLACLSAKDGTLLWQVDTNGRYGVVQNFFGVGATPLVYKDLVWVMVGGSPAESSRQPPGQLQLVKPNGTGMVAFHRETGKEVFRVGNYLASYSAPILATIENKVWCLALMREGLMVFDPETGKEASFAPWRARTLESVNAASPIVVGNEIIISETYEIGSLRLRFQSGKLEETWRDKPVQKYQMMRAHWATPLAIGDQLFGCSGRNEPDADLRCVDWKDGSIRWAERTRERSALIMIDDHLIVLGEHGLLQLIKIDPNRLEVVASYDFERIADKTDGSPLLYPPVWAPPVYSHGYLYLRGANRVVCLDMLRK